MQNLHNILYKTEQNKKKKYMYKNFSSFIDNGSEIHKFIEIWNKVIPTESLRGNSIGNNYIDIFEKEFLSCRSSLSYSDSKPSVLGLRRVDSTETLCWLLA